MSITQLVLPGWNVFELAVESFNDLSDKKEMIFGEYDEALDKSVKFSLLLLPRPLNLMVERIIYDKVNGRPVEKIGKVRGSLKNIRVMGEEHYINCKKKLDTILAKISGGTYDPINQDDKGDIVLQKVYQILTSSDNNEISTMVSELDAIAKQSEPINYD